MAATLSIKHYNPLVWWFTIPVAVAERVWRHYAWYLTNRTLGDYLSTSFTGAILLWCWKVFGLVALWFLVGIPALILLGIGLGEVLVFIFS